MWHDDVLHRLRKSDKISNQHALCYIQHALCYIQHALCYIQHALRYIQHALHQVTSPWLFLSLFVHIAPKHLSIRCLGRLVWKETDWKRGGAFKKYFAGDWMNHLSVICHSCSGKKHLEKTCVVLSSVNKDVFSRSDTTDAAAAELFRVVLFNRFLWFVPSGAWRHRSLLISLFRLFVSNWLYLCVSSDFPTSLWLLPLFNMRLCLCLAEL